MYKRTKKIADIAYKGRENKYAYYHDNGTDIYFTVDPYRIFKVPKEQFLLYFNMNLWNPYSARPELESLFERETENTVEVYKTNTFKHPSSGRIIQSFSRDNNSDPYEIKNISMTFLRGMTDNRTNYLTPNDMSVCFRSPLYLDVEGYKYSMILPIVC